MKNNKLVILAVSLIAIILINVASGSLYKRFDLTKDGRYTLSETTIELIEQADVPLIIDVFLEGNLPSEFRILQSETKSLIEEFQSINPLIKVNYIDPLEDEAKRDYYISELTKSGLEPYVLSSKESGKVSQELLFPWAFASYDLETTKVPLLKRNLTDGEQDQITNSVQNLEFAFADAFNTILKAKEKKIAVLKGNGQLRDIETADALTALGANYNLAEFTLDSVATNPVGTLKALSNFDLILSAKPTEPFTEEEKLVLDQYTMQGGKSIWFTESIIMEKDSLMNDNGNAVTIARDLNLNDFFFKYGVRVNQNLVKDLYSAPIPLAFGEGNNTQFQPVQWTYSPLANADTIHPISNNINLVKFDFASQIDTLKNGITKTVLLKSSTKTQLQGALQTVSLPGPGQDLDEANYNAGIQNLAVLLEGEFNSVYKNRVLPFQLPGYLSDGKPSKIIVVGDGDVIRNEVSLNRPLQLGFDRFTGRTFGNKEFLLNAVNYLLDDSGLINIRSKSIEVAFMDSERIEDEKSTWQLVNIVLPLLILGLFGFLFNRIRKRKYAR
ncbi:gliding motility-associated ABC transporter substrate-binding protein GldG [Winogradskyella maritima]|uniref:Gliding motility-associated ABC transporter substrate-binding protein GldG n=1 Tax=Winogradskyella maritima TaxID=1517766 RepID=A0ABV8AJA5_9FLAO|nr:gliding motility-associated ABC transporter substrate-binding protein GldG [Winogradskyella maritima]